jgi:hypothetical protein
MKALLAAVMIAMVVSPPKASAANLHTCPFAGPFGLSMEVESASGPWKLSVRGEQVEMILSGTLLICKYDGFAFRKEVGEGCHLLAEEGKITRAATTYCTFRDQLMRKKDDCFVICP